RPLLAVRRDTTAAASADLGLKPWQDPHNEDFRFARARVRHRALPALEEALGPGVAEALARTAAQLRADTECLDELAFAESGQLRGNGSDPAGLDARWLAALPQAIRARVLHAADQLQARIGELAAQIDADYAGRDLLLVGVLKGAVMVMADLARAMHLPVQMDWMAISSYGSGTKSSGVVRILKDLDTDITGRHVLIVEDIVDSGLTLSWLAGNLRSRGPASLAVCAMLRKPGSAQMHVDV